MKVIKKLDFHTKISNLDIQTVPATMLKGRFVNSISNLDLHDTEKSHNTKIFLRFPNTCVPTAYSLVGTVNLQ